jgi:hypothetical protein
MLHVQIPTCLFAALDGLTEERRQEADIQDANHDEEDSEEQNDPLQRRAQPVQVKQREQYQNDSHSSAQHAPYCAPHETNEIHAYLSFTEDLVSTLPHNTATGQTL